MKHTKPCSFNKTSPALSIHAILSALMETFFRQGALIKTLDVSFLYDDEVFSRRYAQMSEYRRKKIDFFKFKKDKALSLGAGILMNELIEYAKKQIALQEDRDKNSTVSAPDDPFTVEFSENGKPFFAFQPNLHFSLAHAGKKVIAALSDRKIGVDVEEISESKDIDLAQWTRAESYVKALDLSLSDYIEGKITLPPESRFRQWTEDDYIFAVYED